MQVLEVDVRFPDSALDDLIPYILSVIKMILGRIKN